MSQATAQDGRGFRRRSGLLLPLIPFMALILVWIAVVWIGDIPHGMLPSPLMVARVPFTETQDYLANIGASLSRLGLGLAVGISTGLILGVAGGISRRVSDFLTPLATFMSALSGIAWIPLAIAWFGIGTAMVAFIIWNSVFFLIFGNTLLGVRQVPRMYADSLRTLGASRRRIVMEVVIPGAMPYVLAGLRSGVSFGWRAVVAAELVGASTGLGAWIFAVRSYQRADIIVVGALTIGIIGVLMDRATRWLEQRTVERWGTVRATSVGGDG